MTTHRTDVRVLFDAGVVRRERRSSIALVDRHRDLDPPADVDVRSTGHRAELVPSTYIDYDAIDTLRFMGRPAQERT